MKSSTCITRSLATLFTAAMFVGGFTTAQATLLSPNFPDCPMAPPSIETSHELMMLGNDLIMLCQNDSNHTPYHVVTRNHTIANNAEVDWNGYDLITTLEGTPPFTLGWDHLDAANLKTLGTTMFMNEMIWDHFHKRFGHRRSLFIPLQYGEYGRGAIEGSGIPRSIVLNTLIVIGTGLVGIVAWRGEKLGVQTRA